MPESKSLHPKAKKAQSQEASIDRLTREAALAYMKATPDWFESLPDAEKAKYISRYIPLAKQTENELEATALSVADALGHLPDCPDLTLKFQAAMKMNEKLKLDIDVLNELLKLLKKDPDIRKILKLFAKRENSMKGFYTTSQATYVSSAKVIEEMERLYEEAGWSSPKKKYSQFDPSSSTTSTDGETTP